MDRVGAERRARRVAVRLLVWTRLIGTAIVIMVVGAAIARGNSESQSVSAFLSETNSSTPGAESPKLISLYPSYSEEPSGGWLKPGPYRESLEGICPECDECPLRGYYAFVNYDSWRGLPDGNWQNNGISSGVNFGTRLGRFSDWTGIGFQIGGSAGAYNWAGTNYRLAHTNQSQPQGFVTYGLFRRANENSRFSAAVVQDWMLNSNYGVFAQNPTLSQWRGQAGYALGPLNEIGIWGAWRARSDSRDVVGFGQVVWRSVNQLNGYWHYKWGINQPDTWLWIGVPENDRLVLGGSLGDYVVGALANAPLGERVSLTALVTYMHQSSSMGPAGAPEDAWNFTIGLSFYPAQNARTQTVAGQCWMPLMNVANNGYFYVDTNNWY
jgi:hypothetical protein